MPLRRRLVTGRGGSSPLRSVLCGGISAWVLTACISQASALPDKIVVMYVPDRMEYMVTDGGAARIIGADPARVLEFETTADDFKIISDLLAPLQDAGLTCSEPPERSAPGYISWLRGSEEILRTIMHTACYSDGFRPLSRNTDEAWRRVAELGKARYVAPIIPEPVFLSVERRYWGRLLSVWTVTAAGEVTVTGDDITTRFQSPDTGFEEIREIFRPYESRHFECERVIADLPYGDVIWGSAEGQEDQRTRFDDGCVRGDATDLNARLARADALIRAWQASGQETPDP